MNDSAQRDRDRSMDHIAVRKEKSTKGEMATISVTLCTTELSVGGAEQAVVQLATGLDRNRFCVRVVSLKPRPEAQRDRLARWLADAGIETHFLNAASTAGGPKTLLKLRRLLRDHPTDVLQTFLFHSNVLGPLAAKLAGVPHVVTGLRVAEWERRLRLKIEAAAAKLAEAHVCVSQTVADFAWHKMGLSPDRLIVIPNGVDPNRFEAVVPADLGHLGIASPRRLLVCVGRLDRQKGIDRLIDVGPQLFEQLPEHDLLLVGDGPERGSIEAQARKNGISHRVHTVGWQEYVPGILTASDMLLLPSRWEGMPNVVLEAMASGLPVVAMEVEGVSEILGEGGRTQIVPREDTQSMLERVVSLVSDPKEMKRLGSHNQSRAVEKFGWQVVVDKYAKLYETLAGASRR